LISGISPVPEPDRLHRDLHSFPTRRSSDLRIKLLEEILSFRMQGVEFDNGDMYVDGHKAASDVRDEFVSVTEKLMELNALHTKRDRKSGSAGMPRPISYAVFCLKKKSELKI